MDENDNSIESGIANLEWALVERERKQTREFIKTAIKYPLIALAVTVIGAPIASRIYMNHETPLYYQINRMSGEMVDAERRGDMLNYNILKATRRKAVQEMWSPGTWYSNEFLSEIKNN